MGVAVRMACLEALIGARRNEIGGSVSAAAGGAE
jgi:hypothetical protein